MKSQQLNNTYDISLFVLKIHLQPRFALGRACAHFLKWRVQKGISEWQF